MPRKFEEIVEDLETAGADEDAIAELKEAYAGSPLRKERDTLKTKAEGLEEELGKLKPAVWGSTFKELGLSVKPDAVNLPDDLDPADTQAVKEWAIDKGLLAAPEGGEGGEGSEEEKEHQAGMEKIAAASNGAKPTTGGKITPDDFKNWPREKRLELRSTDPDKFLALKRGESVTALV